MVRPRDTLTDREIEALAAEALLRDPLVEHRDLKVKERDRPVLREGKVDSLFDKKHAAR